MFKCKLTATCSNAPYVSDVKEKHISDDHYVELAVILNFIRYTQTEKNMCTIFIFGLSAIRPRDAVRPRPV